MSILLCSVVVLLAVFGVLAVLKLWPWSCRQPVRLCPCPHLHRLPWSLSWGTALNAWGQGGKGSLAASSSLE